MGRSKTYAEEIRSRLQAAIRASGISQKEIARRLGLSPSTVSKYARMEKSPSVDTFGRLCEVLGVSSDAILGLNRETN